MMSSSRRPLITSIISKKRSSRIRRGGGLTELVVALSLLLLAYVQETDSFSLLQQQLQQRSRRSITTTTASPPACLSQRSNRRTLLHMEQRDVNDNVITVGCVVKVIAENLKAYHVPPGGYGKFQGGKFHPDPLQKFMAIPVGLKGVVTKVYNVQDISAQTPIQVKFEPNDDDDEIQSPMVFQMHFHTYEVQVVE